MIVYLVMNLVQMLVLQVDLQVGNWSSSVLVHALLLSHFCFGNTYSFLVDLQYQRNFFFHLPVNETMGTGSYIYVVTDDVDLAEAYNKACQQQEE